MKKTAYLLILVMIFGILLTGCSDETTEDTSSEEGGLAEEQVLNLTESSTITTLDPSLATDGVSLTVLQNSMEGLYRLDENDQIVEGCADGEPVVSEDGLTWTVKIKEDLVWSNGDPITAHDFVYSWQRAVDPATASEYSYIFDPVENATAIYMGEMPAEELGVKAIDDYTLEIQLAVPTPYFQSLLTFPMFFPQNQAFVESQGDKYGTTFDSVLYNGPFVVSSWEHEVGWTYEKNPNYWDTENVTLEQANVKVVKDSNTALNLYETGELDRVPLTSEQVKEYEDRSDFDTYLDSSMYFLHLNQANEVLANVHARKAINMALDKEELCNELLSDGSVPADYIVPKGFMMDAEGNDFRDANPAMNSYDVEAAQAEWEIAKQEVGFEEVTLTLLTLDTDTAKKTGEWIQAQLETNLPGLTIELKPLPKKQLMDATSNGEYEMSCFSWGPDYLDPTTFLNMFVTGAHYNLGSYSNPEFDEIMNSVNTELYSNPELRWTEMQRAEQIVIGEDQAIVPVYQKGRAYLQNPKVQNFYTHQYGGDYSLKWVYIEA